MQEWWSISEIAEARLPGFPTTVRNIQNKATTEHWQSDPERARRRAGRGGGWEYHRDLFPAAAQSALIRSDEVARKLAETPAEKTKGRDRDEAWASFERLPQSVKAKAQDKLAVLDAVERLVQCGQTKHAAVKAVATERGKGARTIWNWIGEIEGVRRDDRLAYLAPRHRTAPRKVERAKCSPEAWEYLKSEYLRQGEVLFTASYDNLVKVAAKQGWEIPSARTLRRKIEREIPADVRVLTRKGNQALKDLYPAQVRDKTALHAMEVVNADFHKWDVMVTWGGKELRVQTCVWADIYSGFILSWRHATDPNARTVQLAAGDMIERYGIPGHAILDNGKEFAAKWITGGAEHRFRGHVRDEDVSGILTSLGIQTVFTQPYSGQSKPIERTFKEFCNRIAKDIRFDGAYVGNRPGARPEGYKGPVPFELFADVVEQGIHAHNARISHGQVCQGRSPEDAFRSSYAMSEIRKASEAQRRLFMLGAKRRKADRTNGEILFMGNKYWSPWMVNIAGQPVVIRFDPDALYEGVFVYTAKDEYIDFAECHEAQGFLNVDAAREHGKARRSYMKGVRIQRDAELTMTKAEAGKLLSEAMADIVPAEPPEAAIIRPVFTAKTKAPTRAEPRTLSAEEIAAHQAIIAEFKAPPKPKVSAEDEALERFRNALALEARIGAGEDIDPASRDALREYQATPEYRGFAQMHAVWGDALMK
ncbi:MAG: transposase domain-containing protein [Pseudomonadota bacterium]